MKQAWLIAIAIVLVSIFPALAQPAQPYTAPDAELWSVMVRAFGDVPMSLPAHQQVQQIIANVQHEAQMREARAKAEAAAKAKEPPPSPAN